MKAPYVPDAWYMRSAGNPAELTAFQEGGFLMQDVSSQLAVRCAGIRPGDLVFWQNGSGRVYHVGIYSGPDSFIHASNTARGWVFEDHLHDMPEPCGYARY